VFEQAFKNIDDVLRKEAGCTTELDYTEQTSWLLFLKYLDGLEQDLADEAALERKKYSYILDKPTAGKLGRAKGKDGKLDHNQAKTGTTCATSSTRSFSHTCTASSRRPAGRTRSNTRSARSSERSKTRSRAVYNLREIIDHIDALRFRSQAEKHELSQLYEAKIKNMGNAGRNGGEYYTPRPLIRAIVQVVAAQDRRPHLRRCGRSAGFLCESYDHLKASHPKRTTAQDRILQERTFYGRRRSPSRT